MSKCLNCKKPLKQLPGKRKKKYCNSTCRSNHWQKLNPKKKKDVDTGQPAELPKKVTKVDKVIVAKSVAKPVPKTLKELKELCPKTLGGLERSSWIAEARKKYNV